MVDLPFDAARVKLLIALTMYNEREEDLSRTLLGIMDNLCDMDSSASGGIGLTSSNVVVALVADGVDRVHPDAKRYLQHQRLWDPTNAQYVHNTARGTAAMHLFSTSHVLAVSPTEESPGGHDCHLNFIYALKQRNAKKLDSHAWVVEGIAPALTPEFVVFLDVGTRPRPTAVRMLVREMQLDERIAGCCGEITIDAPYRRACRRYCSPVILAQNFEYKMANALDKSFESCFGYVSVLPGAFCAFRIGPWSHVGSAQNGTVAVAEGPLSETQWSNTFSTHPQAGFGFDNLAGKNMYLAEDRVLCWELVAKDGEANLLRYVKGAVAETDPMSSLAGLISQRRRWLNGSLFAKLYAMKKLPQLARSAHSPRRKRLICLQFVYYAVQLVTDWFAVSLFFVQFRVSTDLCLSDSNRSPIFNSESTDSSLKPVAVTLQLAYIVALLVLVITSLSGAKPRDLEWTHIFIFSVFGLFAFATIGLTTAYIFMVGSFFLKFLLTFSLSTYFIVGLVHGELHHVILPSCLTCSLFRLG